MGGIVTETTSTVIRRENCGDQFVYLQVEKQTDKQLSATSLLAPSIIYASLLAPSIISASYLQVNLMPYTATVESHSKLSFGWFTDQDQNISVVFYNSDSVCET